MLNLISIKFSKRVRYLRKSQWLSQEKLGQRADRHYTYIGAVERGERNPSLQSIEKIAKGLDVDIADLFPLPQTLSPEGRLIEGIVNLLRHKKLKIIGRLF